VRGKVITNAGVCGAASIITTTTSTTSSTTTTTLPGSGDSWGDPHLVTFDRLAYDFQAVGEFVLVQAHDDGLNVQTRTASWRGSRVVSVNTAVAMDVAGDRVGLYVLPGLSVLVNGSPVDASEPIQLPRGGRLEIDAGDYLITWPDGNQARVRPRSTYLNVKVLLMGARRAQMEGLLGNFDGVAGNDLVARGTDAPLGTSLSYEQLYREYGDSWRITQDESLFDYEDGATTETYTDRSFPAAIVTTESLPPDARAAAEQTCRNAGVTDPILVEACVLDVALTKDALFAEGLSDIRPPSEPIDVGESALKRGLRLQMYDTPSPANAVTSGFGGLQPAPFAITTQSGSLVVASAIVPVVNFPDTGFDQGAFYSVGVNGVIDAGSTITAPMGDDISIQPPGGNDTFGGSFTGFMYIPGGGDVTFTVGIDDFFDLVVDGRRVMSNLSVTNYRTFSATATALPSGFIPITLNYAENSVEADVVLSGIGGGLPGGLIAAELLAHRD